MKKIYWTSHQFRLFSMSLICLLALFCLFLVEKNKQSVPKPYYALKLEASKIAKSAFDAVKKLRLQKGIAIKSKFDSEKSGLIGEKNTAFTSDHGVLRSKQISLNPNFAGLIVSWLKTLSLNEGDVVAIGMTGSFPALDISTLAAIKELGLKPIVIVSVASSNWGANINRLTILDMLSYLDKKDVLSYLPIAASIGASKDLGKSLSKQGVNGILRTIKRNKITLIQEETVSLSVDKRMELYQQQATTLGAPIKAYINIGGGIASIGKHYARDDLSKEQKEAIRYTSLSAGINRTLPVALANSNSVAVKFLKQGVPVINLKDIDKLALQYELNPWKKTDEVGKGPIFFGQQYNSWLAFFSLVIIGLLCLLETRAQIKKKTVEMSI